MTVSKTPGKRRVGDGTPGPGRPKGQQNRVTGDLKNMVLHALDEAGGAEYLLMQAFDNPQAFMTLVGKCLPKDLNVTARGNLADLLRAARERAGRPRG